MKRLGLCALAVLVLVTMVPATKKVSDNLVRLPPAKKSIVLYSNGPYSLTRNKLPDAKEVLVRRFVPRVSPSGEGWYNEVRHRYKVLNDGATRKMSMNFVGKERFGDSYYSSTVDFD